jgi:hypothetical protein
MADVRGWVGLDWEFGYYVFVPEQQINSDETRMPHDAVRVSIPEQDYADYLRAERQLEEWSMKMVQLYRDATVATCIHPGRWESGERAGQCIRCGTHLTDAWSGPDPQRADVVIHP